MNLGDCRRPWLVALILVLVLGACTGSDSVDPADISFPDVAPTSTAPRPTSSLATPTTQGPPTGGVVRVGLWAEPDPQAPTLAGAIVRSVTQPQLFEADADGGWTAGLVRPGSDVDGPDLRSASFELRSGAMWSDGSPITVADLERSADDTFVESIDQDAQGRITVRFNQPLVNWRVLWSGTAVIEPPAPGVFGGPFVVETFEPGLRTVLVPNRWWWGPGPYLDRLEIVVVPDHDIAMRLFATGELDVVSPWPSVGRLAELEAVAAVRPVQIDTAVGTGWWTGMTLDPARVDDGDRAALASLLDAGFFAESLLKGEVVPLPGDPAAPIGPLNQVTITAADDVPMLAVANRAIVLAARSGGGTPPEVREGDSGLVETWLDEGADVWVGLNYEGPGRGCWTCRYGWVDEVAARLADGGGPTLDELLDERSVVKRWWNPIIAVASSDQIVGPEANGWALGPIWNAHTWYIRPDDQ
ncbi:MAG: hypothetical protein KDB16_16395 [Acidimicrobiales bacterium]|nr:hypothetical protein [Acidimicrobiales bacterium]